METAFIAQNFVPPDVRGLLVFLLIGIPVAFGLAAAGLLFGFIGIELACFGANHVPGACRCACSASCRTTRCWRSRSSRSWASILERSGMAEDLLETVGPGVRARCAAAWRCAVILVGALLAATTGVVAAAVIADGPDLAARSCCATATTAPSPRAPSPPRARWRRPSRRRWC
jgi:TRAP-type mannitol/chloroaromatic compound transport system permease large subunit